MNLLAIDTSTELATVALAVGEEIFNEEQGSLRQHAQLLLPMIEKLLSKAALNCKQLDAIVFGCGPGSFTGLRIACSVAKGLAYAHDLPLYPVSSLAAIAYTVFQREQALPQDTEVLAMIDARMQQLYWGCFKAGAFNAQEQVTAAASMRSEAKGSLVLAGVGFEAYLGELPHAIKEQVVAQHCVFPTAQAMIQMVQSGQLHALSAADALPVYVRNQVTSS